MARKKLNKKVAIIGAIVFVFLALAVMGLLFLKSRNPSPFIADGDKAMDAKDYAQAVKSYLKAADRARADSLKIVILYKLADAYFATNDWPRVVGCWERIVQIEPANVQARLERLRYFYALADSGINTFWQTVQTQVEEFIDQVDKSELAESLSKWKTADVEAKSEAKRVDSFLYFVRGRAYLGAAGSKQEAGTEDVYAKAIEDFQKVLEIEPDNVNAYLYLAQTTVLQGRELALKGSVSQRVAAEEKAIQLLTKCTEITKDDPKAYMNLLGIKLVLADQKGIEEVKKLEPDYLSVVQRFSNNADVYAGLASLYLLLSPQQIDKAAQAIEKAADIDKNDFKYAQTTAIVYLYQFAIHGRQSPEIFAKSVETSKKASLMPQAQDTPGPHRWAYITNKMAILEFIANRNLEQILYPFETISEQKKQQLIKDTEDILYQIQQVVGSGEHPAVVKWNGMLDLAKGNTDAGVRKLNSIYEKFGGGSGKTAGLDPIVPYALAKVYENSSEQGAVLNFLTTAMNLGIARFSRPEAVLEYCQTALKLEAWPTVVSNVDIYEKYFGPNQRSHSLKILANIGAGDYEQAQKLLAAEPQNDPNTYVLNITFVQGKINQIRSLLVQAQIEDLTKSVSQNEPNAAREARKNSLKSELTGLIDSLAQFITKLSVASPSSVNEGYVAAVCEDFLADGRINQAKELVNVLVKNAPDNLVARFYQKLLSEPQPDKLTVERRTQIEEQIYKSVTDPLDRAMNLGAFYKRNNESAKAAEQFKIALGDFLQTDASADQSLDTKTFQQKKNAVDNLFNAALVQQEWQLAMDIQAAAKRKNLDGCEGNFYAARLAAAKKDKASLGLLDECLKEKPIFSFGFLLRSNVWAIMGNEKEAIDDAKKAVMQNPQDGAIAKNLASLLFLRNQNLGKTVSNDQKDDLKSALDLAMRDNNGDMELFSFYAEFISDSQPDKALAIRRYLLQKYPNVSNAMLLGQMAVRRAGEVTDQKQKAALFEMAKSAFEQGKTIEPNNRQLIASIAGMYTAMGQPQLANKIIQDSNNQTLLWANYYQNGQYDQAQKILTASYQSNPKDTAVLRGLLAVSEKTMNKDDAQRYGTELVAVDDTVESRLLQVQVYLNTGLTSQAENLLQAIKEKFPDEPRALYIEAFLLSRQGKLDNALNIINQCIEKDKTYAPAWQLRGKIYQVQADFTKAINDFQQCKLYSDDPTTGLLLAQTFLSLGRDESAVVELKSIIDNPQVATNAASLLEGIYRKSKKTADLIQLYADILKKNPDNIFWLNRAAKFTLSISDFKSAEQLYTLAFSKSPEGSRASIDAFNGYLEALLLSRQYDKLFQEANKHLNDYLTPIALLEMADASNRQGNKQNAIKYARDAAEKVKNNDTVFYETLTAMLKVIGQKPLEDYCNEILSQNPSSLPALRMTYNLKLRAGDYQNAINAIDKCIAVAKNDPNKKTEFVVQKAGVLYSAYQKTSDKNFLKNAANEYESLLKELPKNRSADIMNNLAYILAAGDERLADAMDYAKQAYQLMPNNPEYLDTYAFTLYKNEKYSEAEQYIQAAIQLFVVQQKTVGWDVYDRAALILEKRDSRLQAIAAYKQALQAGADEMADADKTRINAAIDRLSKEQ
jgi:tetratricopeptide (TPR) repeat protein